MLKAIRILSSVLTPLLCFAEINPYDDLIVFVGEKISVRETTNAPPGGVFGTDSTFIGKYKVLQVVDGRLDEEIVEFTIYDHYGSPYFAEFQHVLLYLQKSDGTYWHEKYQFDKLYKTVDGKWAGPYSSSYRHVYNSNTVIRPIPIHFDPPAKVDISKHTQTSIERWFPDSYFIISNGVATATHGNYIPELYELRKTGVLKARRDSWDAQNGESP